MSLEKRPLEKTPLEKLDTELKLRGYSPKTAEMYKHYNEEFVGFANKNPDEATEDDVKSFMAHKISGGVSPKSVLLIKAALKFFYGEVLKKDIVNIKSPKAPKKLPVVLTKEEVKILINSVGNEKHRLIVALLYSSGLRLSELVNLKVGDIELDERIGWVRSGKGAKDRMFILPEALVEDLRNHFRGKAEDDYVFEGQGGQTGQTRQTRQMTPRNIQKIVSSAAKNAGISKPVHVHTLRHTFATHLLESGENIRKIQELLGHSDLSTTQIYTHVSTEELKKIKNPLDSL